MREVASGDLIFSFMDTRMSFSGRPRDELLNETLFGSLALARRIIEDWRIDYNGERPQRASTGSHQTSLQAGPSRP
jgi:hypothetical protein